MVPEQEEHLVIVPVTTHPDLPEDITEWDTEGEWDVDMPGEDMEEVSDSSEGSLGEGGDFWVEVSVEGGGNMPGGDESGPWGRGPMTGRGAGYCAGFNAPGFASGFVGRGGYGGGMGRGYDHGGPIRGFGGGRGRGMGRGLRGGYGFYEPGYLPPENDRMDIPFHHGIPRAYSEPSPEEEKSYLEDQVRGMEAELEDIKKRIKELTKEE